MDRIPQSASPVYPSGPTPPNDEVDLSIVFRKIQNGFASLGRKLRYVGGVIARRFPIVAVLALLGLAISYYKFVRTPPEYVSSMTLTSFDIRNDYIEKLVVDLNQAVSDNNGPLLANMLNLPEATAKEITLVEYRNLDERLFMEDSIMIGQPFVVTVSTLDKNSFPALEKGITGYLENNPYFANIKAIRKQRYENLNTRLNQELRQIDSLKTKVTVPSGLADRPSGGIVIGQPADPVNMYKQSMELFNQQLTANGILAMAENINIISGLTPRRKPASPILEEYLLIGLLIGFLVGTFLAVLYDKYKNPSLNPLPTQPQMVA